MFAFILWEELNKILRFYQSLFRSRKTNTISVQSKLLKLHSHQTPDQPPLIPDQFLWLGRVWLGKKLPALIEERIYPRSNPAVSALYPWCIHAQIPLFPTYTRPSGWPIPALYDQPPTYSWYNYAHYAQYRTNPRSDFNSRPQMNNSSKCYAGFSTRNAHMAHIVN